MRGQDGQTSIRLYARFRSSRESHDFDQLHRAVRPLVLRWCQAWLGRPDLAEDAAQAVFLVLLRRAPDLRDEAALTSWLWRTARLISIKLARKEVKMSQTLPALHSSDEPPEFNVHVAEALDSLGDKDRSLLTLRYSQELTVAEVAECFGIGVSAAQMRISRAIEKLREKLRRRGIEASSASIPALLSLPQTPAPIPLLPPTELALELAAGVKTAFTIAAAAPLVGGGAAVAAVAVSLMSLPHILPSNRIFPASEGDPEMISRLLNRIQGDFDGKVEWSAGDGQSGSAEVKTSINAAPDGRSLRLISTMGSGGGREIQAIWFEPGGQNVWIDRQRLKVTWGSDSVTFEGRRPAAPGQNEYILSRQTVTFTASGYTSRLEEVEPRRFINLYTMTRRPGSP